MILVNPNTSSKIPQLCRLSIIVFAGSRKQFCFSQSSCRMQSICVLVEPKSLVDYAPNCYKFVDFSTRFLFKKCRKADQTACKDPLKFILHRRLSSTKGFLPPKDALHQRSSSTKGHLLPKVIFHRRSSFTEGCLPPKVFFHQWLSSTKGFLPPKVVFHLP